MKSKIQFILSMVIFSTIGLVVRHINLSSSETALVSSTIDCVFLLGIFKLSGKKFNWTLIWNNSVFTYKIICRI